MRMYMLGFAGLALTAAVTSAIAAPPIPEYYLSGTIANYDNLAPIAGAGVALYCHQPDSARDTTYDTTDASGAFSFRVGRGYAEVGPFTYKLAVYARIFAADSVTGSASHLANTPVSFALHPTGIKGTVTDIVTGLPVAGVTVHVADTVSIFVLVGTMVVDSVYDSATTDAQGKYAIYHAAFADCPTEPYWFLEALCGLVGPLGSTAHWNDSNQVRTKAPYYADTFSSPRTSLAIGQMATVDVAIRPHGGTVSGSVTDSASGTGIPGAVVYLEWLDASIPGYVIIDSVSATRDGGYSFRSVPTSLGTIGLVATARRHGSATITGLAAPAEGQTLTENFMLSSGMTRVVQPPALARVTANSLSITRSGGVPTLSVSALAGGDVCIWTLDGSKVCALRFTAGRTTFALPKLTRASGAPVVARAHMGGKSLVVRLCLP
jgi:hypothetical protein